MIIPKDDIHEASSLTILQHLQQCALSNNCAVHEIPQEIHITQEKWTKENGFLTSNDKIQRSALIAKYSKYFDKHKLAIDSGTTDEQVKLTNFDAIHGICQGIHSILIETVPSVFDGRVPYPSDSLFELGADSLAAALFVSKVNEYFGTKLTLPEVCKLPTLGDVQSLVFGDHERGNDDDFDLMEDAKSISTRLNEELEKIDIQNISSKSTSSINKSEANNESLILLTGSTGFVGAFLLAELVKNLRQSNSETKICCLVRAKTNDLAKSRVQEALIHYGLEANNSIEKWTAIAGKEKEVHIEVFL